MRSLEFKYLGFNDSKDGGVEMRLNHRLSEGKDVERIKLPVAKRKSVHCHRSLCLGGQCSSFSTNSSTSWG